MNKKKYLSYFITFLIIFLYSFIFFKNFLISIILSGILSYKFYFISYEFLINTTLKKKRIMFREFLDIFNSCVLSGQNFYNALVNTSIEIKNIFHEKIFIIRYLDELIFDIDNGIGIEEALRIFKNKSNLEEIDIFVDSLNISIKSGINISKITRLSKDMLTDNISLELQLTVIADNSKKEFIIMSILPLIILFILNNTRNIELTYIDYLIRIPVFILFIFSFYLGQKIISLEN